MKFLTKPLTFLLLILPFVSLAQTPDAVYCVDALGTETYSVTPSDPANSFSWSSDNSSIVFNSPTAQSTDVDWAGFGEGTYTLIFTEESSLVPGCSSSVEFIVQIGEGPEVQPIAETYVCENTTNEVLTATATGTGLTFDWGQTTGGTSSENLDLNNVGAGYDGSDITSNLTLTGTLTVSDANNCSSTEDFNITIVNTPEPGVITND